MKPMLGRSLKGKKVVSASGIDLGYVLDTCFEVDGSLTSFLVKPEQETADIRKYIDKDGILTVPYADVKAVGRYLVVNFPFTQ